MTLAKMPCDAAEMAKARGDAESTRARDETTPGADPGSFRLAGAQMNQASISDSTSGSTSAFCARAASCS